jgi:hypothetical protein
MTEPEPELTADVARQLFGRKTLPTPAPEGQTEPSKPAESTKPPASTGPAPPEPTPPKLTADQLELATRYGLSAQDAKRVRGDSWAEKCEDAERLAELAKPGINEGELAALAAYGQKQTRRNAWWLGGGGEARELRPGQATATAGVACLDASGLPDPSAGTVGRSGQLRRWRQA